jgi:DNA polymerase
MMFQLQARRFNEWRSQAKILLSHNIPAHEVTWVHAHQSLLFGKLPLEKEGAHRFTVPADFIPFAETIACHRLDERWNLLYRLLYRVTHGEKHLLCITVDPLVHQLHMMEKAIRRDSHKMKAFVRFRKVEEAGVEHYIAWHEPDHYVVKRTSPFFARRFSTMRWSILTPDDCAHWDGERLIYSEGVTQPGAADEDMMEGLWRDYYRATFNPARIKIKMMKQEMPVRYWKNLPETQIIQSMLDEAPERVENMLKHSEGSIVSAADFLPIEKDISHLREAAKACEGCDLFKPATQSVFGEGSENAPVMFVGEQPGNEEDLKGRAFVGPAGALFDEALHYGGLKREDVYITHAIKHFRFIHKGEFREHVTPLRQHVHACSHWLTAEISAIKPRLIICLGNSAARALLGPGFTMKTGRAIVHGKNPAIVATYDPAAILRAGKNERETMKKILFLDISNALNLLNDNSINGNIISAQNETKTLTIN